MGDVYSMALIFLDLETTGLHAHTDRILEIAAAVVDEQLNPISGFTAVIKPPDGVEIANLIASVDPVVREMHHKNGLWNELPHGRTLSEVTAGFCGWLAGHKGRPHTLAGDSVHFDLAFLKSWLPVAAMAFSHRLLDVSAFRVARDLCGRQACPIAGGGHRAQSDVMASIAKARWHLSRIAE